MSTKPETMDAETLEALRGSIARWERIAAGEPHELGAHECALCKLFNPEIRDSHNYADDGGCYGCPVYERTGESFCGETPYSEVLDYDGEQGSPEYLAAAKAELDFLKSLLPTEAA